MPWLRESKELSLYKNSNFQNLYLCNLMVYTFDISNIDYLNIKG